MVLLRSQKPTGIEVRKANLGFWCIFSVSLIRPRYMVNTLLSFPQGTRVSPFPAPRPLQEAMPYDFSQAECGGGVRSF